MKAEYDLLLRCLHEGSIRGAVTLGLEEKSFSDPVAALAFRKIMTFTSKPATLGRVPTLEYMGDLCPGFPSSDACPERTVAELVEIVQCAGLNRRLRKLILEVDEQLTIWKAPEIALQHLVTTVKSLSTTSLLPSHLQMDLCEATEKLKSEYTTKQGGGGVLGIPYPWEPLNEALGGQTGGTFNVVYAPSKHGKTWMSLEISAIHPFLHANVKCLVISCEMPVLQIYRRIAARLSLVDYAGVVNGSLSRSEAEIYFEMLDALRKEQLDHLLDDSARHRSIRVIRPSTRTGAGVDTVRAAIDGFEPDIVLVDSVYRLADPKGRRDMNWNGISENMSVLKDMSAEYNIPVNVTCQANRKGWGDVTEVGEDDYGDIAGSMSFITEADSVIRLHKFRLPNRDLRILFTMPGVRESEVEPFLIRFKPTTDFGVDLRHVTKDVLEMLLEAGAVLAGEESIDGEDKNVPVFTPPQAFLSTSSTRKS